MKQGTKLGSQKGRWIILAALVVVLGALLYLLPGGLAQAQQAQQSFTYAEDDTGPVATFSATDPEGVTPIVWSLLESDTGTQDLGIFEDPPNADDVGTADVTDFGDFSISQSGVLTFDSQPDFEEPTGGVGGNSNTYRVVVQASDGGVGSFVNWFKVIVNVTDVEEAGTLAEWTVNADGEGDAQTPGMLLQFQPEATLTMVNPTDSDGGVTNVRWQWYRTPNRSAMGTPIDGATAITYTVSDTSTSNDVGMYLRVVATYSDDRGPNKTAEYVSVNPVQAARDDNTPPEFALTTETRGITENATGNVGAPLKATDDDGDILTYSLADGGADNGSFSIDRATGQLGSAGLDFEMPRGQPLSQSNTNDYVVTVKATDSHGVDSATVTVTITVTDVNEVPTFTAGTQGMADDHQEKTGDVVENELVISTYVATDPEGANVTLSLMGDDAASFELADDTLLTGADAPNVSQVLSFKERPDFENPGDRNGDNVYEVTVRASDGRLNTDRMVTIKVTDADEAGEVEVPQDALIGVELTATLTDSDTGAPDPAQFIDQVWQWHSLEMPDTTIADTTAIAGATSPSYTPVAADRDRYLRAVVTYTDRTRDEDNNDANNTATNDPPFVGFTNTATSNATTAVRNNPSNQRPVFTEGTRTVRLVEENTEALADDDAETTDNPADNVGGGPVVATDIDGDTVNYTLTGSDMFRVRTNGQIEVSDKAKLDYEASRSHRVTLTANDGTGESNGTASITVTINVTDLDERPTITDRGDLTAVGEQTVEYVENDTGPVIRLMATDPEGVTPIVWSLLESDTGTQDLGIFEDPPNADDVGTADVADFGDFAISQDGVLTFASLPNFEMAADEGTDNEYNVVVQVSDGGVDSHANWFKVTVNVTDEPEGGSIAEWTIDPDTGGPESGNQELLQFNAAATLTVTDEDLTDGDGTPDNVQWQWYRMAGRSGTGTPITGATGQTYAVVDTPENPNDVGTYLRVQATYDVDSGVRETASFVSINPVQATRQATNTPPEFPGASVARRITEDTTGNVGAPVRATDADRGDILTYSLADGGADNGSFSIDRATGQLMVGSAGLDFEMPRGQPLSQSNTNDYVVMVTATDSSGGSDDVTVTITVTDVNDAPTFTAGTQGMADDHQEKTGDVVENELVISTYVATDPEGANVTLSLMGDDAASFELADDTLLTGADAPNVSQVLSFKERPDFENPGDRNGDNVYEVTVRASDGRLNTDRMVTIKVTDADEAGEVEVPQDALIGVELTATLTDSDTGAPDPAQFIDQVWQWHSLEMPDTTIADTTAIAGATSPSYTPVAADRDRYLRAVVTYTDRTRDEDNNDANNTATNDPPFVGFTNTATSNATTAVRNNPSNQRPVFTEGTRTVRLVEENTEALADDDAETTDNPADNVGGGPVVATDIDGDTVNYTLTGSDMFRVRTNGQIEVSDKADLDYEKKSSHTVMLTATDTSGTANNSASIEVTIYVTDLDERPVITEGVLTLTGPMGSQEYPENDTEAVGTYRMGGAEVAGATMELMGDDAGDFTLEGSGMSRTLKFTSTPNFEMPMDMDEDNEYKVTVRVRKGHIMAMADLTVTVTDEDELGRLAGEASPTYAEDRTDAVGIYEVRGGDGSAIDWSLEGADAGQFTLDGTGMSRTLMFSSAPDFEAPADADGDNEYMVTVKAEAGGEEETVGITINVTDVDEHGTLEGDTSVTYAEDRTDAVGTYEVTGGDGTSAVTWSLEGADAGQFTLEGTGMSRTLMFSSAPDFEAPADADGDNGYMVTVKAEAGGEEEMLGITINVTDADELGTLEGDTNVTYAEDRTDTVGDYEVTGGDGTSAITWSLEGADAGQFTLEGTGMSRTLMFSSAPDFEAPADADGDNEYMVTVKAEAGGEEETVGITINVTDVDELGTLAGDTSVTYAEDRTDAVATYEVTGGDGTSAVTWSLEGAVAGQFTLEGTGMSRTLMFSSALDFEAPADADGDNGYMVTVKAEAGGEEEMLEITINVTDVDELGTLEGDTNVTYAEDRTDAVGNYEVRGGDGSAITWSLEGADAGQFTLDGTGMSRTLMFSSAPDFEAPADAGGDNEYMVTVKAEAGGEEEMLGITINVTDVAEHGTLEGDTSVTYAEDRTDAVATYEVTGGDGSAITWSLEGADAGQFMLEGTGMSRMLKFSSAPDFETPADADGDNEYMITVKAEAGGEMKMVAVEITVENVDELGTLDGDTNVTYAERRTDAVATYEVTGGDGSAITWSLEGADAGQFTLDGTGMSRTLMFSSALDFEAPADADGDNGYMVTVKAEAGGEEEMVEITINVTDVAELGTLAGDASLTYAEDRTDAVGDYEVTGGDGSAVTWSLEGADAGQFTLDGTGMSRTLMFSSALDFEAPADADGDNGYMVTVKAEAGGEEEMLEITINVTDVDELGTLEGDTNVTYAEDRTDAVGNYEVRGGDGSAITWSLEGADAGQFTLEGTGMSRMLMFSSAPDFEAPADADGDNGYMVTVKAEAGGEEEMLGITINVTDVAEDVSTPVQDYDTNNEEGIQIDELFDAIDDYFAGGISISDLFDVIDAYFE